MFPFVAVIIVFCFISVKSGAPVVSERFLFCTFANAKNKPIMMNLKRFYLVVMAVLAGVVAMQGAVRLPQLFQSGMVLQRNQPVPVWGWADAGESVTVTFLKKVYTVTADTNGCWRVNLPAMKAGGPYELRVNDLVLSDVLVGDVWLLSGQSNIDVTIERVYPQYVDEIDHFSLEKVHVFRVQNETSAHGVKNDIRPTNTNWKTLTKQNVWLFSAVGSFLGKRMWEKYKVPQGVIVNSWGGTPIEAWISADSLRRDYPLLVEKTRLYDNPDFVMAQQRANTLADQRWNALLEEIDPGVQQHFTSLDYNDADWQTVNQDNWQWRGIGTIWLRQHVHIDKEHAGKAARLLLGTLYDADITYVNGQQVGRTYYQYPPRRYDLPEGLLCEGDNVITIRFVNKNGAAHFIPQKPYLIAFGEDRFSQNPMPADVIPLGKEWKSHAGANMPACPSGDVSLQNMATTLYNAVVHPLAPFALSGVVWYQGESNTGNPAPYADYLQKLMGCWRDTWQKPELPFCIVQLANHDGRQQTGNPSPILPQTAPVNSNWARLREAQRMVANHDAHAEQACIIDLGETVDIHPLRKKEVAERIGLCFDRLVYKDKTVLLSPQPVSADLQGSDIVITFDQPLSSERSVDVPEFEVAGVDGRFVNVDSVRVVGSKVTLKSPISAPGKVRYAWKDSPQAVLRSVTGLPVSPFEYSLK